MISFPQYLCQVGTYLNVAFVLLIMTQVFIWRKPQIIDLDVDGHAGLYGFYNRSSFTALPPVVYWKYVHLNLFC